MASIAGNRRSAATSCTPLVRLLLFAGSDDQFIRSGFAAILSREDRLLRPIAMKINIAIFVAIGLRDFASPDIHG
jgi:hypothetical protein